MFAGWVTSISKHYDTGKPKHVSLVDKSFFAIIDNVVFSKMPPSLTQIQLQKRVIVIRDMTHKGYPFSRHGIRDLNGLNTDVKIEGMYNVLHYHTHYHTDFSIY